MNGEKDDIVDEAEDVEDVEDDAAPEDTVVLTEDLEDIEDLGSTTELDVDKLVEKIDKDGDAEHKKEVHRRMEELAEKKREQEELDSTFNFNLDDEL